MTVEQRPHIVILADDLSGAAESAALFLDRDVSLGIDIGVLQSDSDVRVLDLGTRVLSGADAAARVQQTVRDLPSHIRVVKKVDSMLRGNVAAEVETLLEGGPVVFAAGLPALGRTVENGVPHIGGLPLHLSGRWALEKSQPPTSIADLFGHIPTVAVGLEADTRELTAAMNTGAVAVFDVRSDADLDAIVAMSAPIPGVRLVGTSALAAALARTLQPRTVSAVAVEPAPTLIVVGTAEPVAAQQVLELERYGATHVRIHIDDLLATEADPAAVRTAVDTGAAILTVTGPVDPDRSSAISGALADLVAEAVEGRTVGLVLTGGETARRVLDALSVTTLHPIAEVHHGAVVSRTAAGAYVATRPGSFGGPDSLVAMTAYLRGLDNTQSLSHSEALA
ncbi:four-carbon acid sugar kinase family protein [Rhodococcus sp. IEGM 1330]|uniref:four-carbon acid sugar kinase family protein n=1 Tax=Rhodococcus sp. IEGM 1330 TaxID=3082225 RepID=UPI0029536ADA|nr:four-carbon acid sugar kinase family protein [Rhodococcus sp. IEGM 1330]MDV8023602.1 four-carbon acid sugar kinase family protein [Rhodococcus sp. IEGM 1330]